MNLERRHQAADVELRHSEGEPRRLAGYASVFWDGSPGTQFRLWDGAVERILPGAFDDAIANDDVRGLFNHDSSMVLGRNRAGTLELRVDQTGLWYSIDLPDTQVASDVAELVRRGDVSGSSFAFQIEREEWRTEDGQQIREVQEVRLFDVGPVTFPAYADATTDIRCARASLERRLAAQRDWMERRLRILDIG